MEDRIRDLHKRVTALCAADAACNVRLGAPETRRYYVRVRVEGADALCVGKLAAEFPDCLFYLRCVPHTCAIDVYLPTGRPVAVTVLTAFSVAAAVAAFAALAAATFGTGAAWY